MNFVDWCELVLNTLLEVRDVSQRARTIGVDEFELSKALSLTLQIANFRSQPEYHKTSYYAGMFEAIKSLKVVQCIENDERSRSHWKVSRFGQEHAADPLPLWTTICQEKLDEEHAQFLSIMNRLSPQESSDHVWLKPVGYPEIVTELAWPKDRLWNVAHELKEWGFLDGYFDIGGGMHLTSTYYGCVWETRRSFTLEAKFIDELVTEWETTSVDFKRQLSLDTMDQKAEFVKDILSLINTKASGRRWLIIGFDDRTHAYFGPPDSRITQNRIEQLLAQYIHPYVDVRYEAVEYRAGRVGKLEVLRDPKKLPYRVKEQMNRDRKPPLVPGDLFVRHGSQAVKPEEAEVLALQEESDRANSNTL